MSSTSFATFETDNSTGFSQRTNDIFFNADVHNNSNSILNAHINLNRNNIFDNCNYLHANISSEPSFFISNASEGKSNSNSRNRVFTENCSSQTSMQSMEGSSENTNNILLNLAAHSNSNSISNATISFSPNNTTDNWSNVESSFFISNMSPSNSISNHGVTTENCPKEVQKNVSFNCSTPTVSKELASSNLETRTKSSHSISTQTELHFSNKSPRKKILRKKIDALRKKVERLEKKLHARNVKCKPDSINVLTKEQIHLVIDEFFTNFYDYLKKSKIVESYVTLFEQIPFVHPCNLFPYKYLLKLFARVKLFFTLKFINRNFRLQKGHAKNIILNHN